MPCSSIVAATPAVRSLRYGAIREMLLAPSEASAPMSASALLTTDTGAARM